jgi:hypothetical protein
LKTSFDPPIYFIVKECLVFFKGLENFNGNILASGKFTFKLAVNGA